MELVIQVVNGVIFVQKILLLNLVKVSKNKSAKNVVLDFIRSLAKLFAMRASLAQVVTTK